MTLPLPSALDAVRQYAAAGLCVLQAIREGDDTRVALRLWKSHQTRLPTPAEHSRWFGGAEFEPPVEPETPQGRSRAASSRSLIRRTR